MAHWQDSNNFYSNIFVDSVMAGVHDGGTTKEADMSKQPTFYAAPYLYDTNTVEYGVFVRGRNSGPLHSGFKTLEAAQREADEENKATA